MTQRTEWPDYDQQARDLEEYMAAMTACARANGWEVIVCIYNELHVPVLKQAADAVCAVEGQELSDEQMLSLTEKMVALCGED